MASVEWGKKKVTDLFDVYNTHNILSCDVTGNSGTTPYLGAGAGNNSIISYISYNKVLIEEAPCIFIGGKTFVVTYQENDFFSNDSHNLVLYVKDARLQNKSCQLLLVSCIYKSLKNKYSWGNSISYKKIQDDKIVVPIKNNTIAFEFMESFIEELEAERIEELEAYLSVSGLKDTQLTADELSALDKLKSNKIFWKEYTIDQLFDIVTTAHRFDANKIHIIENGRYPYIVRTSNNNGQRGFIDENPIYLNSGNTISFGQDTATIFYQEKPYFTGDKIKILIPKLLNFRKENAQFFISTMNLTFSNFTWGSTRFNVDILKNQIVKIPISSKDKEIDFVFMETLIKAIQKLVIADVVKFSDEKIKATKQVVG